ncbi:MAG: RNA pyrophosphohydrolase [Alphaproteobacteria bacterium ADurb.Bin438]|nr:MAG: RNA pyrophosphohydrolase [Alphaproteobacteria bacterium ADurb.Bin438]
MKYRKNVGIILINHKGLVFMAKRKVNAKFDIENNKCWQMPQGGIDENETPKDAVYREMMEEIGTNNVKLICESNHWYNYDFPKEVLEKNPLPFIGQTQKWFLFQFMGQDSDFNFEVHNPEFCDFKWVEIDEIASLVIDFKAPTYEKLIDEFKPIIKNLFD